MKAGRVIALLALAPLLLGACSLSQPPAAAPVNAGDCPPEAAAAFLAELNAVQADFERLAAEAEAAPAVGLEPFTRDLEALRLAAEELPTPDCGLQVQAALAAYTRTAAQVYFRKLVETLPVTPQSDSPSLQELQDLAASQWDYYETLKSEFVEAYEL